MTYQEVQFGKQAREEVRKGVNLVASAVKVTLGPEGRTVALKRKHHQLFTKDGVTVAESINLENRFQSVGADALKEAARKTNDQGGDGTTVTTILAQAMIEQGFSAIESGFSPILLKQGMKKAVEQVIEFLSKLAIPIKGYEMIKSVASISANDKEMGTHIANLFHKLGKEGVIVVEEGKTPGYEEEYLEGLQWDKPMISPYMMTDLARRRCEMHDPFIVLTDSPIEDVEPITAFLDAIFLKGNSRKLVVICNDIMARGLETIIFNNRNVIRSTPEGPKSGTYQTLAVRAPYSQLSQLEALEDMAAMTGGLVYSKTKGLILPKDQREVDLKTLGRADKVISDDKSTVIIGGKGSKKRIKERISVIKAELKKETREWEIIKLKERLSRLTGQAAVLRFGAENESMTKEMKYRIEDSINATRNALEEGIVPGGEVALLRASQILTGDRGVEIVKQALLQPIEVLAQNAGNTGNQVIKQILKSSNKNFGWDAAKDEYGDMIQKGIIDPVKVVKAAVINAVATTSTLLTTEFIIADIEKEEKVNNKDR